MTAVLAAMLVLSWVAIALLALGYAGLVAQIRELQTRGVTEIPSVYPEFAASTPGSRTLVLTLTSTCSTCDEVFNDWPEVARRLRAAGHRTALVSIDGSSVWTERGAENLLFAADLSAPLLLAYQPALVLFDDSGTLLSANPLGSAAGLHEAVGSLLTPDRDAAR